MAMVVKNNMSAVRTLNTLNANTSALQKSLQKVSSGMKINSAQDDASGYAISERMRVRIRSLDQANQNTQNDASLMKTAEGAVGNTVEILRALKEKAINAANDSNTDEDRQTIQKEINQFIDQIDDNALVQFNGKYLIDGSKNNATTSSKTILLNQSLHTSTLEDDALTTLRNRAGDSLGIQTSDKWQVSWVENGNIKFASGTVGDKSLEAILNKAWDTGETDADGNAIMFGQVAATTNDGLISSAKTEPKYTEFYSYTGSLTAGDDLSELVKAHDSYSTTASGSVSLTDLGIYKDAEGSTFDDTVGITWDSSGDVATTITGLTGTTASPVTLYAVDTSNDTVPTKASTVTLTNETSTTENVFTSTLAKELVASGLIDVTKSSTAGGDIQTSTTLSKLMVDGTTNTPKYYMKATDGSIIAADDIVVTRIKQNGTGSTTLASDTISFSMAPAASSKSGITDISNVELYEYGYDGGSGFTDAWDKFGKAVYTPDKTAGVAVAATNEGVNSQLSGLTISILDQDGNVKKAANAALDQFKQYQRAENQTGDMSLNFHIGSEANVAIKVGMSDMRSEALGLKGSDGTRLDVYTKEHANAAINVIENALTKALDQQTTIGAIEARLEYTSTNLTTSSENVQAAESTIRDADMAKEMTNYTKSNVLLQAAQAMLAQANQNSSAVLSLLQ